MPKSPCVMLPLIHGRIALHTAQVLLGNVGTYHKMDFTALGNPIRLARGLLHETREQLRDHFEYAEGSPRTVAVPGMGSCQVWDVARRKPEVAGG
jgi:class 3 adenylate cyclase